MLKNEVKIEATTRDLFRKAANRIDAEALKGRTLVNASVLLMCDGSGAKPNADYFGLAFLEFSDMEEDHGQDDLPWPHQRQRRALGC